MEFNKMVERISSVNEKGERVVTAITDAGNLSYQVTGSGESTRGFFNLTQDTPGLSVCTTHAYTSEGAAMIEGDAVKLGLHNFNFGDSVSSQHGSTEKYREGFDRAFGRNQPQK